MRMQVPRHQVIHAEQMVDASLSIQVAPWNGGDPGLGAEYAPVMASAGGIELQAAVSLSKRVKHMVTLTNCYRFTGCSC